MRLRKSHVFLVILLLISSLVLTNLYTDIPIIKNKIVTNIKQNSIRSIDIMLHNFTDHVITEANEQSVPAIYDLLTSDPKAQKRFESELNLLVSKEVKYAYMLYRDSKGKFRFLLDGASEDKVRQGRKFDTHNQDWDLVYSTKTARLIEQKNLSELWMTYIFPVIQNEQVVAVIGVDLSLDHHYQNLTIIEPLENMLIIVLGLISIIVLTTVAQFVLYFFTHRKVYLDALTGIRNRQFLNDILPTMNFQKYHIAMLDIDRFKTINDSFGHETGDYVLQEVTKALKQSIRDEDLLIRYGGEEFILFMLARNTSEANALKSLERIRNTVENLTLHTKNGTPISPTISIGANLIVNEFKNVHDAIKIADQKLYEAKVQGRNRVLYHGHAKNNDSSTSISLNLHQVKEAIEEQRLFFEYQPIVDLESNQVIKNEVLTRIRHSDGTIIYPISFLPHIMNTQVYKEMTLYLLRYNFEIACNSDVALTFNLNITDFLDEDISNFIIDHFKRHPNLANHITFELLEEEKIQDIGALIQQIHTIHDYGAKVAIDDFGTGYSNFSHLLQLDIDIIKIDGSLIRHIDQSDLSLQLVEAIAAFAKASNKSVVAEFIHNEDVMNHIKNLGIELGQGFYLSKPLIAPLTGRLETSPQPLLQSPSNV